MDKNVCVNRISSSLCYLGFFVDSTSQTSVEMSVRFDIDGKLTQNTNITNAIEQHEKYEKASITNKRPNW